MIGFEKHTLHGMKDPSQNYFFCKALPKQRINIHNRKFKERPTSTSSYIEHHLDKENNSIASFPILCFLVNHPKHNPDSPHADEPLWTTPIPCHCRKVVLLPLFLSNNPSFLGFLPFYLDFFEIQGHEKVIYGFWATFHSGWCFLWKSCRLPCKILFLWYFSNFQKLVRVKSASMTNKTPSGGVVCRYCHNPGHVPRNCRKS